MPLSLTTVIARMRELVAQVEGLEAVYAPTGLDAQGVPDALHEFPCAVLRLGRTVEYNTAAGGAAHEHVYEVIVDLFSAAAASEDRAYVTLPMIDRILELMTGNVGLGGRVRWCLFKGQSGDGTLVYGGQEYLGYELTFEVSESASVTFELGEGE